MSTVFATYDDYVLRYGAKADTAKVEALLEDASNALISEYEAFWCEDYTEGAHKAFDRNVKAVCCSVANRSLSVRSGFEGASQYSQTAGSYNASVTFSNPTGEMYLSRSDLKKLGLHGQRMRSIMPSTEESR